MRTCYENWGSCRCFSLRLHMKRNLGFVKPVLHGFKPRRRDVRDRIGFFWLDAQERCAEIFGRRERA